MSRIECIVINVLSLTWVAIAFINGSVSLWVFAGLMLLLVATVNRYRCDTATRGKLAVLREQFNRERHILREMQKQVAAEMLELRGLTETAKARIDQAAEELKRG